MIENNVAQALESLRPQREGIIMDLVAEAGIDVSPWSVKKDGSAVRNPRANPNYCYEWAFGGSREPTALCVWHRSLTGSQGLISFEESLRKHALKLDLVAINRSNPAHVKSRARDQAKRARNFDLLLQRAFRKSEPIRVVLLLGEARSGDVGWDTAVVKYRSLDTENWYVHSYSDEDGSFRLVRSVPRVTQGDPSPGPVTETVFEDQFSVPEQPQKRETTGATFARSQEVRQAVLRRAAGICECCGAPGFETTSGAIYLETHHVIPLSETGPDIVWNVVAICPNDHRRAHFGNNRDAIGDQMIAKLVSVFPDSAPFFAKWQDRQKDSCTN